MPFLSILWLFTWKWSFAIFLDYHGPGHKQITKVRWVCFFFFFLVMSVVHNVTWKKSTIVSMEWSQSLFIETGWPVYFSLFSFFSCNIHMYTDIHTCRHTNIYVYTCNMHLHVCMQSHKHFCLSMHYTLACMHTLLYIFLSNTHMQCHAHNIFFSVNMCNIYSWFWYI